MNPVYLAAWLVYLGAAVVLYRVFLRPHLAAWFPNILRVARIVVLVLLFSPALMTSADQSLVLAPSLLAFAFQLLMKAPLGMFKVALSWFLFGGIWLWLDALWQRQHGTSNS